VDVLGLFDKFARLVEAGKRVPVVDQVRIERAEIVQLLGDLRACLGAEGRDARWLVQHRQEVLAEAARECDRMLIDARGRAALEQKQISRLAERQADRILAEARKRAFEIGYEVEEWADELLGNIERNLSKFVEAADYGRRRLHERSSKESALPDAQADSADDARTREAA
jgi:hypothetical protein